MSLQAAPSDRIGAWVLGERLGRDRLGEVFAATGPDGVAARLRITPAAPDRDRLAGRLALLATVAGPGIAPVLDTMLDDAGHGAVATPADAIDLERRARRRRLDATTVAALGAVLLDGLTGLHARGVAHGTVGAAAVGIDAGGHPHWLDAGLAAALRGDDQAAATGADVARCAAMLRDLGRLPAALEAVLDPVAAGSPGAISDAAALAAAWRGAAAAAGLEVPPPGSDAALVGLLPPPPRRRRLPVAPRIALRPARRRQAAVAVAVLGAGFLAAAAIRGSGSPLGTPGDYLPAHPGMTLSYRLTGEAQPTTLRVAQAGVVAGVFTVVLERTGGPALSSPPLGIGGTTLRLQDGNLVRTAAGGAVRDLVAPLSPGASWSDQRSGAAGIVTRETRTVLGTASLIEPGGRFDRCAVVSLTSSSVTAAGAGQSAAGTVWLCPGVGLTRAVLRTPGQAEFDVDLVSAR